jgi:hypothetical protein
MKNFIVFTCLILIGLNQMMFGGRKIMKETTFKAKRISRTNSMILNASLKTVFPLFGPIAEKKWAYGWDPQIIFSSTNRLEPKMVFKTQMTGHHEKGETHCIWIVSRLIPQQALIEYTVFTNERVWWITIQCQEHVSNQTTRAKITYTFTGLTEKGNAINEKHLARIYAHDLKDWEESINYFLKTGKTFRGM